MPRFVLRDSEGREVRSDDLLGRGPLVVFFYPRDESWGCTVEACAFRDQHEDFVAAGAAVVGISPDSADSHKAFAANRRLPYLLLSDPDKRVFQAFGVDDVLGVVTGRETFVMDAGGVVRWRLRSNLMPTRHVRAALEAVRAAPPAAG
jgi:thioredoxin-dependent peroxiredoxin